jgi:deazaflavin-dependent oxidoreductase (nitroreductase family)
MTRLPPEALAPGPGFTETERPQTKERHMTELNDWNATIIAEFRANEGRVGGAFEGAPLTLVHHRGRRSGREYVSPTMYLADQGDADDGRTIYVFGSKAGAPTHPDWYYNLISAGRARVEVGTETYDVTVSELTGEERDRLFEEQARRYPRFAEYAEKAAGIRTIPVLALRRA